MPLRPLLLLILAVSLPGASSPANPPKAKPPSVVGTCAFTTVKRVETRLEDEHHRPVADSGSAVELANGVYGVSYDRVPAVEHAKAGDRVMTCLARIPNHCPPGDGRGKWYTTTDFRTDDAWTLPDAEHECGGA